MGDKTSKEVMPNAKPAVLDLKDEEIEAVEEFAASAKSAREFKRAQAVLYKTKGTSMEPIAQLLGVHRSTAQRYIARYKKRGIASFKDKPRPGREPKLTKGARKKLLRAALKEPRLFGFLKNNWGLGMLKLYIKKETGIDISEVQIWRVLKKHGIVYKRPKLIAPEKRGKGPKRSKLQEYRKSALKKG